MTGVIQFPSGEPLINQQQPPKDVTGFYSTTDASRIAMVPRNVLYSWRDSGIVIPRITIAGEFGEQQTGYEFDAVVYLRLVRMLRDRFSLEKSVRGVQHLVDLFGAPGEDWMNARLYFDASGVYAMDIRKPDITEATRGGQFAMEGILFEQEFRLLGDRPDALLVPRKFLNHVQINPEIRNGKPVVMGTATETGLIHRLRDSGHNEDSVLEYYPHLKRAQVRAAHQYERDLDRSIA